MCAADEGRYFLKIVAKNIWLFDEKTLVSQPNVKTDKSYFVALKFV